LPAQSVFLSDVKAMASNGSGSVYFSETGSCHIRRWDPSTGLVHVVVSGPPGFSGDGGPASAASFNLPIGLAIDSTGSLYVADCGNYRIRRVDGSTGIVTTVVGNGTRSFPPTEGTLATETALYGPSGVGIDRDGSLLFGDSGGLYRVSAATRRISKVSDGNLELPDSPVVLPTGSIVATDELSRTVRRIDPSTRRHVAIAGGGVGGVGDGGPPTAALLPNPVSAVRGPSGDLSIAEWYGHRIRRVSEGVISTYAGTGIQGSSTDGVPRTATQLYSPHSLAVDRLGNLFVSDMAGDLLRIDATSGKVARLGSFGVSRLAVDGRDQLYVAQLNAYRVVRVDPATGQPALVAGNGTQGFSGDGGPAAPAAVHPNGIAADSVGNLYIADWLNARVRKVDAGTGVISTIAGGGTRLDLPAPALNAYIRDPRHVALDGHGGLLIGSPYHIARLDLQTGILAHFAGEELETAAAGDGGPFAAATFSGIWDLSYDAAGNLLVADAGSNLVRAVFACVTVVPPTLSSPADGATGTSTGPTLTWSTGSGAFRYDIYLGTTSPPTTVVARDLVATSFTASNLQPGTKHFWKVVAKGDPYCVPFSSAESAVRSFTTSDVCASPSTPPLYAPLDGASGLPSSVLLEWIPCCGAGSFDIYLGSTNPPPPYLVGLPAYPQLLTQKYRVSDLAPGGLYYWSILAHASCDPSKTTSSTVRSFRVAGAGCPPPGTFSLSSPADGSNGVSPDVTLSWTTSTGASSYDLHLGFSANPPLYLSGLTSTTQGLRGLAAGATYRWKVVARSPCETGAGLETPVRSFTVRGTCVTPGATSFTFLPPGGVGAGQSYVVAWSAASGLGPGDGYVVERSTSPSFSPLLDTVTTSTLFASFVAPSPGSLYHRVRAVPACDPAKAGPWSPNGLVSVTSATPNVVFSRAPEAMVLSLGDRLEDQKSVFSLENVTSSPIQVFLGRQELSSPPFFTVADPSGGDAAILTLEPHLPKLLEVRYSGPRNDVAGAYQGVIFAASVGAGLAVTPWAYVSLKVGSSPDAVPEFRLGGVSTEYAAFPGLAGSDAGRAPISVDVFNPGPSSLELGAEVGPELWLALEPGWNSTPIPAGGTRTLRLSTVRMRAPNGSALPRYTYLTLRSRGGTTSRLLVQDNDAPQLSSGRGASAVRPEASFLVPSVAHVTSALGNTFVSRLSLSNAGTEAVQAELVFTPAPSGSSLVDGFDTSAIRRATVVVPPNDLVRLSDPLVLLFGLTPPVSGTLEVRAPSARAGFLSVSSSVDAPSSSGGTFGFALPVFKSGEGIRAGSTATLAAVASDAAERTNLILAETTGVDAAWARVSLLDRDGTLLGSESVAVPRWGQQQLSRVLERLGGAFGSRAARLEVSVESGGGTLAAVTTVVDNANDDDAAFAARDVDSPASASRTLRALKPAWARATGTVKSLVPALVNGYQTFPASAEPFTFRSVMGFSSLASASALFRLTYYDLTNGQTLSRELRVPGRKTLEYTNVLEQLFGIPQGAKSQGPLFVESDPQGLLWCRVASSLVKGTIGDSFPVVPVPSDGLTGAGSSRVLQIDGLEHSVDRSRGTRSNLILNEVAGKPLSLLVSLYEAGNRSSPIASRELSLKPLEKLQLSTVFAELGLDQDDRRKDRTNVLCTVKATTGDGLASALVTTIDNRTGDTRNSLLAPASSGAPGVTIGF
jgi:sugar lactone lactonase YvrE